MEELLLTKELDLQVVGIMLETHIILRQVYILKGMIDNLEESLNTFTLMTN